MERLFCIFFVILVFLGCKDPRNNESKNDIQLSQKTVADENQVIPSKDIKSNWEFLMKLVLSEKLNLINTRAVYEINNTICQKKVLI